MQDRTRFRGSALVAAAALLGGVVVAGCGAGSSSPPVAAASATATSSAGAAAGGDAASSSTSDALAYARCMRANGVSAFPDPRPGGGFVFPQGAGVNPSSPAFQAAQAKCAKLLPSGGGLAPGAQTHPSQQALARMLAVAQCMRRHGIADFPDPRTSVPVNVRTALGGHGVISDIEGVILVFPATIDEQSSSFTSAASACAFPLHNH